MCLKLKNEDNHMSLGKCKLKQLWVTTAHLLECEFLDCDKDTTLVGMLMETVQVENEGVWGRSVPADRFSVNLKLLKK